MDNEPDFWAWLTAGIGFGIGLGLVSVVFAVLSWTVMEYRLKAATDQLLTSNDSLIDFPIPTKDTQAETRTIKVPIPPQSREECLKMTDGVANKFYHACRNGNLYQKKVVAE